MPNDKEFELDDLESFSFDDLSLDDAPASPEADEGQDPMGVWVKSAPEDVAERVEEPAEAEAPAVGDLPEEDFLSSEELAHLDDSFDFVTVEEPQEGEAPIDDEVAFLDTPEAVAAEKADGAFDEVSLDDFVSFDDVGETRSETILAPVMDTPSEPEDDFPEEFLDIDIDIDDEINDDALEVGEAHKAAAPAPADDVDAEDIDLSEFGDFEEVSPSDPVGLEDLDLPPLDTPAAEEGFFEEEVLEPDDSTDMDHILALEEDLTSGIRASDHVPAQPAPAAPAAAPAQDLAAAILGKIEQELSSIKQEISALKNEVTHLRSQPGRVPEAEPAESDAESDKPKHGFFDDDEDEAIALTGDELDNILSTAEVSEGEEAGVSLDDDLLDMDVEGNLIEPEAPAGIELENTEEDSEHVTDEEFLAGTSLDLNEPDPFDLHADAEPTGVPESIELEEEDLPLGLEDETEDLLADAPVEAAGDEPLDFDLDVTDAGILSEEPEALPLFEPEAVSLEPDLVSEDLTEEPAAAAVAEMEPEPEPLPPAPPAPSVPTPEPGVAPAPLNTGLKDELRAVLSYMDKLLAALPDDKIQEFAESEHFEVYKRLFEELGLIE